MNRNYYQRIHIHKYEFVRPRRFDEIKFSFFIAYWPDLFVALQNTMYSLYNIYNTSIM